MRQDNLYNKNVSTTIYLAKQFMLMETGNRVPTFETLAKEIDVARGTVQNSMKVLQDAKAVKLSAKGHLGTFLIRKNIKKLLKYADIRFLLGAMPLPYTKIYEGLASGLIENLQNKFKIGVNMAYMRDALNRIDMLLKGRCDFVICSKTSAKIAIANKKEVVIAIDFGDKSYLNAYGIVFADRKMNKLKPGMRVGIENVKNSRYYETLDACNGVDVEFIPLDYAQIIPELKKNNIDAAVWNKDEIENKMVLNNFIPIDPGDEDITSAVILVQKSQPELVKLLEQLIDIDEVRRIQDEVINEVRIPKY